MVLLCLVASTGAMRFLLHTPEQPTAGAPSLQTHAGGELATFASSWVHITWQRPICAFVMLRIRGKRPGTASPSDWVRSQDFAVDDFPPLPAEVGCWRKQFVIR